MRLFESFLWGILAALGALAIEVIFSLGLSFYMGSVSPLPLSQLFAVPVFIIISAVIEETFKCLVIFRRVRILPLQKSYIADSLLIGSGFFGAELALIAAAGALPAAQFLAEIAIVHIGIAGLIGWFASMKNLKKPAALLSAAGIAVIFHATYNLLASQRGSAENYVIFPLLGLLILINAANFLRTARQSG